MNGLMPFGYQPRRKRGRQLGIYDKEQSSLIEV
jgi:hypothetical protein